MAAKSTSSHYGNVAVTIHWLTALLIIALLGSGFRLSGMEDQAAKAALLRVHIPMAVAVLLLTVSRIIWWLFVDQKPAPVSMPTWQDRGARAVHFIFYVVILGMVASGIGMLALSGAAPIIFGGATDTLPNFMDYKPRIPHGLGARIMVALFVFHAGAALYHQFIVRDGLLGRMWFRRKNT